MEAEVSGIQFHERESAEAADCAEGAGTVCEAGTGIDATEPGDQHGQAGVGAFAVSAGVDGILWLLRDAVGIEGTGRVDTTTLALCAMEAVEDVQGPVQGAKEAGH